MVSPVVLVLESQLRYKKVVSKTQGETISVLTYDGFKGNERPRAILVDGERLMVARVERSWISSGPTSGSETTYGFVVLCEGGARFRVLYTDEKGWWARRL
jgi:hypothetical protein